MGPSASAQLGDDYRYLLAETANGITVEIARNVARIDVTTPQDLVTQEISESSGERLIEKHRLDRFTTAGTNRSPR